MRRVRHSTLWARKAEATEQCEGAQSPAVESERRSPLRPHFSEGWRKSIPSNAAAPARSKFGSSISVWVSQVDTLLAAPANLNLLTEDDRGSLGAFRSVEQRHRATAARILLRLSLSLTIGRRLTPKDWRFERTAFGKPFIKDNDERLDFSVSHAGSLVMVAVGQDIDLGVDVETLDQQLEDTVIDEFCDIAERQALRTLPGPQRVRGFIQLWTQKEAYTKMLGLGHSLEFQSFNLQDLQENGDRPSRMVVEGFYFSLEQSLYHAALVISRKTRQQALDLSLITSVPQSHPACALSHPFH